MVIPPKAVMVENILRVYDASPEWVRQEGSEWYAKVWGWCEATSRGCRDRGRIISPYAVAALVAVLSPRKPWGYNLRHVERCLASWRPVATTRRESKEVTRILDCHDYTGWVFRGPKVTNFYNSITSRGLSGVCVDRHAARLAGVTGNRGLMGDRYERVADAYRDAAGEVRTITAAQLQAITWIRWRMGRQNQLLMEY